jgi:HAD superfamily hydrolase (TIGR01490 family)
VWDWTVERFLNQHWRADTRALLESHQRAGEPVILVSSGPEPLIWRIARELGAEHAVGTILEVRDGRYTGRSLPPACVDENKAVLAQAYLRRNGLQADLAECYAYADSISDFHLLAMVGIPMAVYPEAALQQAASERGWRIFPK